MPFLVPLIAPALVGTFGGAVLGAALSVGGSLALSYAATKLRPKVKSASAASGGVRLGLQVSTNPSRQVIIGETATSGSLVYWQLSGDNNSTLHMVIALADHECQSLQSVIVNNKTVTRNAGTGEMDGFGANLIVRFYSGVAGQTADSELVSSSGGRWTANEVGTGVCYAVVKVGYDEKLFPQGIPELAFVLRGAKLIDPRTGSAVYSDNPAVAIYNILRGISVGGQKLIGMNVPADAIRTAEASAAANACDELVALKAGGTEKRYRCGVVLDCSQTNRDLIETLLASMAGEVIEAGGIYRIMAGVAQTPVAALTDDDLIVAEPLVTRPKRGRNEIVNAMQGSYTDPARLYQPVAIPPRTSTSDETADGGIRLTRSIDLVAVTSRTQAQRVLEVERKRARRMASASMRVRARWAGLEPGDWITFTSSRRGYVSKTFVIQSKTGARDLASDIVLVETDEGIDDWTAATDEIDDSQVINLASAGPGLTTVSAVAISASMVQGGGGEQRPSLKIDWTPIADPTVIGLRLEYRKVGDTVALERSVASAAAGTYSWLDGVQGNTTYEARLRLVTMPERSTTWSAWATSASAAPPQIVSAAEVADTANDIADGIVTPQKWSDQSALEIHLAGGLADIQGSVSERLQVIQEQLQDYGLSSIQHRQQTSATRSRVLITEQTLQTTNESFAAYQIEVAAYLAAINGTAAGQATAINGLTSRVTTAEGTLTSQGSQLTSIDSRITAAEGVNTGQATAINSLTTRVTNTEGVTTAQAGQLSSFSTTLGQHTTTITQHTTSINGFSARWGVNIDNNGRWIGGINLDGTNGTSTIDILAGAMSMSAPDLNGGAPIVLFQSELVNGVPTLRMNGNIEAKKVAAQSIETVHFKSQEIVAVLFRNEANTTYLNAITGDFQVGGVA